MSRPITRADVIELLRTRVAEHGGIRALARDAAISAPYLSQVLRGRQDPGPMILRLFGLERIPAAPVTYRRTSP